MEIISSNNHLKDTKTPAADNRYNCDLPIDMSFGVSPTAHSRGKPDIELLVACKVQLSSEVITCKTENFRLVKELESAISKTNNLQETMSKLINRTKELEDRLRLSETENLCLKQRNVTMDAEKSAFVQKISMGFDKYHSFPSSETAKSLSLSREGYRLQKSFNQPVESYIQVSHTLIEKMNKEMAELREMSCQYRVKDECERPRVRDTASGKMNLQSEELCNGELEETVSGLLSDTRSIKQCLFDQRRQLQSLLKYISPDEQSDDNYGIQRSASDTSKIPNSKLNDNGVDIVPTKCSGTSTNLNKLSQRKEVSPNATRATIMKESQPLSGLSETQQNLTQSSTIQCQERVAEVPNNPDHKICPICEESFNHKTQKEFEEHVLNHLERESASLLDQYVVI